MPDLGGQRREPIALFVVGAVVGAVVIGLAWLAFSGHDSNNADDPAAPAVGAQGDQTNAAATQQQQAISRVQSCAAVYVAQDEPLQAADAALSQWEVHVGAMNKLVTGAISLHQANQFWNSTRVGAKAHLNQFADAMERYGQRTNRCPQRWAESGDSDLRTCRTAVAERNHTLRLATVALKTWSGHVREMDMLRAGKMSPQHAETMWIQSWTRGNHQVHAYRSAEQAAKKTSC